MESYRDELYHHGVKGMKWGVRKDRYKSMSRRDRAAQRYKYMSDADFSKINKREQKAVGRAENKLAKAQSKGASAKKIAKLERNVSDRKVHADLINKRNKDWQKREIDYIRNTNSAKRIAKSALSIDNRNYTKATDRAFDDATKKYGAEQVKRIERKDTAKAAALTATILATYGAVAYANYRVNN